MMPAGAVCTQRTRVAELRWVASRTDCTVKQYSVFGVRPFALNTCVGLRTVRVSTFFPASRVITW